MNKTFVPNPSDHAPEDVLATLSEELPELTPELRKAASYVLENPNEVSISSIREIADAADVKPNTFMRLARSIGFEGYETFRTPFREAVRQSNVSFPDRARWLQSVRQEGQMGALYADMVSSLIANLETSFASIAESDLRAAAEAIWHSRQTFTLGVGVNSANAQNFTYLASTGMVNFQAIPKIGTNAEGDLAWADRQDVLIAITCRPFRREVVEAVKQAKEQGMTIIAISDSAASPIMVGADHRFVISVDTPQFFPTSVTVIALLETLLSFVVATADEKIVDRVEEFHRRRHQRGIYLKD